MFGEERAFEDEARIMKRSFGRVRDCRLARPLQDVEESSDLSMPRSWHDYNRVLGA